jgi:hypothetical protein
MRFGSKKAASTAAPTINAERELNHGVKAAPAEANANLPKTKTAAVRRRASRKRAA